MSFRQIADSEMDDVLSKMRRAWHAKGTLDFVRDIWGDDARQVLIQVLWDSDGWTVESVEVTGEESESILPDFTLPFWQEAFKEYPDFFEGDDTFREQLTRVKDFLDSEGVYQNYEFDPDDDGRVLILSELRQIAQYPELYRREG